MQGSKNICVFINYFTKSVEVELMSSITATKAKKVIWKNIITQFNIPKAMIFDNVV